MYLPLCTSENLMWHTEMENLFYSSASLTVLPVLNGNFPHLNQPSPKNNLQFCCHYVLPRPVQIQSWPSYYVKIGLCKLDTRGGEEAELLFALKAWVLQKISFPGTAVQCHHPIINMHANKNDFMISIEMLTLKIHCKKWKFAVAL